MKTLKKNWVKMAAAVALAGVVFCGVYACISAWGQTAPVLNIAVTNTNQISLTVSNGITNGVYQIYYREFLTTNYPWIFVTNGAANQTSFLFNMGDTLSGYFEAAYNTNFAVPTITVIIQSPANGSLIY